MHRTQRKGAEGFLRALVSVLSAVARHAGSFKKRLTILEERLLHVEKRLNVPPTS
ncbi:exported hypothetical protein [Candidatus Sulfopaludibacter sp. SbA3]|nr:exported hypothetical protein [Candidatus Sulfopaludibacter sp. SbA3]